MSKAIDAVLAPDAKAEIHHLKELFCTADTDSSGSLDDQELAQLLKRLYAEQGITRSLEKVTAEVQEALSQFDSDGSGAIEFPEFISMVMQSPAFKFNIAREIKSQIVRFKNHALLHLLEMQNETAKQTAEMQDLSLKSSYKDAAVLECQQELLAAQQQIALVKAFATDVGSLLKTTNQLSGATAAAPEGSGKPLCIEMSLEGAVVADVKLCQHCVSCDLDKAGRAVAPVCEQVQQARPGVAERLSEWLTEAGGSVPAWMAGGWCEAVARQLEDDESRLSNRSEDERLCLEALQRQLVQTRRELQQLLPPSMLSPPGSSPRHGSPRTPGSSRRHPTPSGRPRVSTTPSSVRGRSRGESVEGVLTPSRGRAAPSSPTDTTPDAQIARVCALLRAELDRERVRLAQQVSIMMQSRLRVSGEEQEEHRLVWSGAGRSPLNAMVGHWHALRLSRVAGAQEKHESMLSREECVRALLGDHKEIVRSSLQFLGVCEILLVLQHQSKMIVARCVMAWRREQVQDRAEEVQDTLEQTEATRAVEMQMEIDAVNQQARVEAEQAVAHQRLLHEAAREELIAKHRARLEEKEAELERKLEDEREVMKRALQAQTQELKGAALTDEVHAQELKQKAGLGLMRWLLRQERQCMSTVVRAWHSSHVRELLQDTNAAEDDLIETVAQQSEQLRVSQEQLEQQRELCLELQSRVDGAQEPQCQGSQGESLQRAEHELAAVAAQLEELRQENTELTLQLAEAQKQQPTTEGSVDGEPVEGPGAESESEEQAQGVLDQACAEQSRLSEEVSDLQAKLQAKGVCCDVLQQEHSAVEAELRAGAALLQQALAAAEQKELAMVGERDQLAGELERKAEELKQAQQRLDEHSSRAEEELEAVKSALADAKQNLQNQICLSKVEGVGTEERDAAIEDQIAQLSAAEAAARAELAELRADYLESKECGLELQARVDACEVEMEERLQVARGKMDASTNEYAKQLEEMAGEGEQLRAQLAAVKVDAEVRATAADEQAAAAEKRATACEGRATAADEQAAAAETRATASEGRATAAEAQCAAAEEKVAAAEEKVAAAEMQCAAAEAKAATAAEEVATATKEHTTQLEEMAGEAVQLRGELAVLRAELAALEADAATQAASEGGHGAQKVQKGALEQEQDITEDTAAEMPKLEASLDRLKIHNSKLIQQAQSTNAQLHHSQQLQLGLKRDLKQSSSELRTALAQLENLSTELEESKARLELERGESSARVAAAEKELVDSVLRIGSSEAKLASAQAQVCALEEKVAATEFQCAAAEEKVVATEQKVAAIEVQCVAAEERAAAADERATAAEEKAAAAEERATAAEVQRGAAEETAISAQESARREAGEMAAAEGKAAAAEERAAAAEERATAAVGKAAAAEEKATSAEERAAIAEAKATAAEIQCADATTAADGLSTAADGLSTAADERAAAAEERAAAAEERATAAEGLSTAAAAAAAEERTAAAAADERATAAEERATAAEERATAAEGLSTAAAAAAAGERTAAEVQCAAADERATVAEERAAIAEAKATAAEMQCAAAEERVTAADTHCGQLQCAALRQLGAMLLSRCRGSLAAVLRGWFVNRERARLLSTWQRHRLGEMAVLEAEIEQLERELQESRSERPGSTVGAEGSEHEASESDASLVSRDEHRIEQITQRLTSLEADLAASVKEADLLKRQLALVLPAGVSSEALSLSHSHAQRSVEAGDSSCTDAELQGWYEGLMANIAASERVRALASQNMHSSSPEEERLPQSPAVLSQKIDRMERELNWWRHNSSAPRECSGAASGERSGAASPQQALALSKSSHSPSSPLSATAASALEGFRNEVLLDLSPSKEAALSERVREMLRARGESHDVGLAVISELQGVLTKLSPKRGV